MSESSNTWRILVVDDEPSIRHLLQTFLERHGHQVAVAQSREEALVRLDLDDFHLVIADRMLPDGDGVEVAKAARLAHPRACVLLITGNASAASADALVGVADDYLEKPFFPGALYQRLTELMARRRALNDLVDARPAATPGAVLVALAEQEERGRVVDALARAKLPSNVEGTLLALASPAHLRAVILGIEACTDTVYRAIWRRQASGRRLDVVLVAEPGSLQASLLAVSLSARRLSRPMRDLDVDNAIRALHARQ